MVYFMMKYGGMRYKTFNHNFIPRIGEKIRLDVHDRYGVENYTVVDIKHEIIEDYNERTKELSTNYNVFVYLEVI